MIEMQNYFKLALGFSLGDTGTGKVGNCTTNTVGSNYGILAISTAGAVAADSP